MRPKHPKDRRGASDFGRRLGFEYWGRESYGHRDPGRFSKTMAARKRRRREARVIQEQEA